MPWKKGDRIPTNLIVGFLGSGKTTAIANLIKQRPDGEHWSILINEFGIVSIDHALVGGLENVAVEKLGGGCACCTMSFAFKPLLAQFIRRSKPDRLILEPSGLSHPAKVVDILRSEGFARTIDLRNIICLIDPKDFDDPRWQESEVFKDQVQLADIVVLNWTDLRDRKLIDRCREWVENFNPPKQLILETEFGVIDPKLLDMKLETVRFPLFSKAHPLPKKIAGALPVAGKRIESNDGVTTQSEKNSEAPKPAPGHPLRFQNNTAAYDACGWIFHVDDVFDRSRLLDFLAEISPIIRLKGVFRCKTDWWVINRAKDSTDFATSTYRRGSRLEIILDSKSKDWAKFENHLLLCLAE